MLGKDGKTYIITNFIFFEDEPSFLAKEKVNDFGDELAFKYAYENSMPAERSRDESTVEKGATGGEVNREVEGEEERDVGETRSHDLVEPIAEPAPTPIRELPYQWLTIAGLGPAPIRKLP